MKSNQARECGRAPRTKERPQRRREGREGQRRGRRGAGRGVEVKEGAAGNIEKRMERGIE